MEVFSYQEGQAFCEGVSLSAIADSVGTPAYIYSKSAIVHQCKKIKAAFEGYPTFACFALKANNNLSVLKEIFSEGLGADVVSVGELEKALLAGARPDQIVYSGVGKRRDELTRALQLGLLSINIESADEMRLINGLAKELPKPVPVSLRINPNIAVQTNPKIATGLYSTKFGISEIGVEELLLTLKEQKFLRLIGISCHVGSQLCDLNPFEEAVKRMAGLAQKILAQGFPLKMLDMGGGLGIRYRDEDPPSLSTYANTLIKGVKETGLTLLIEPGRSIVGAAGVLLTRVLNVKQAPWKNFVVVDAGMNDLLRPTLYEAYHEVKLANLPRVPRAEMVADIVGPLCESSDFLARNRKLMNLQPGDLLFLKDCGAYGSSMASNYNARPRAAEVMVDGAEFRVARKRERLEELWAGEI